MTLSPQWRQFYSDFRSYVDTTAAAESPNNQRPCPLCGISCNLKLGRHMQKWRWHHPQNGCENARLERKNWQEKYQWSLESAMFKDESIP